MSRTKIIPTTHVVHAAVTTPAKEQTTAEQQVSSCSAVAASPASSSYLEQLFCGVNGGGGGAAATVAGAVHDDGDIVFYTSRPPPDDNDVATALCNSGYHDSCSGSRRRNDYSYHHRLSDDPTVQESIECVFSSSSSQLEAQEGGLPTMLFQNDEKRQPDASLKDDDEHGQNVGDNDDDDLVAPSVLQQCMLPNRSAAAMAMRSTKKKSARREYESSSRFVHVVGTACDPPCESSSISPCKAATAQEPAATTTTCRLSDAQSLPRDCPCCHQTTPILDRERWPQFPLLLRPTPGSGTRVTAIRTINKTLWDVNQDGPCSNLTWPSALHQLWGSSVNDNSKVNEVVSENHHMEVMCPQCMILPINNGNEEPGEALLTDFESDLFIGTLLLRMRHVEGTTREKYNDDKGYFKGVNRRYQAVIRGRFKQQIPLTQCLTGFQLDRPCGKLPPKWIMNGSLKVLSFFAPQLQANLDGERPSSLTPLGSTPQVLAVHDESDPNTTPLEGVHSEPVMNHHTLLGRASDAASSFARARLRKKQFDKLFIQNSATPMTNLSKVYTFEFLQHLFQVMALLRHDDKNNNDGGDGTTGQRLWSFDVWHESLIDQALQNEKASSKGTIPRPK
jgi:Protein of unknown function (DUF1769)